MIANIPMWKLAINNGIVEVAILYKDKGGRKSVAIGSTGSPWARAKVDEMFKQEIKRSYGEKSKAALGLFLKTFPENVVKPFLHSPADAQNIVQARVIPITSVPVDQWPDDAKLTISKFPFIKDYGYLRDIGGKMTFKVMVGSVGKTIR